MTVDARSFAAHLAIALTRYVATARADGVSPPLELLTLRDALVEVARSGHELPSVAASSDAGDGPSVERKIAFDVREAAEVLSISERSVRRLIADGRLPTVQVGRRRLIGRHALESFVRGGC